MSRRFGWLVVALATIALTFAIADDAQARRRGGSWGSNGSWGSSGGYGSNGSNGSFGGRFRRGRNNGSCGSHGGYGSNGGWGSNGGNGSSGGWSHNGGHTVYHHEGHHHHHEGVVHEEHEVYHRGEPSIDANQPMAAPIVEDQDIAQSRDSAEIGARESEPDATGEQGRDQTQPLDRASPDSNRPESAEPPADPGT